jgi:hypothetical protein
MTETETKTTDNKKRRNSASLFLRIILAVLILVIAVLVWQLIDTRSKIETIQTESLNIKQSLQSELDSVVAEHEFIKEEYGALADSLSTKDSIILANAKEIQKLLDTQWEYYKVKKKLALLRKITKGYVHQVDSLFKVNQELKDENLEIKRVYRNERRKNTELEKEKEQLVEKMDQASVLKAYNVKAFGIYLKGRKQKEENTDKARKIEKVKVCFTLAENLIVPPGKKNIYIRIARPDKVIISKSKDEIYTFDYNGEKIQYTMMKEVDYNNKAMELCLYWTKQNMKVPAMTGVYHVDVFADGNNIGHTQFELK